MRYHDLRSFLAHLEETGELIRVKVPVDPVLEMTEICDRTLRRAGPALLFEQPRGGNMAVLANLFGTPQRVALGMGAESISALSEIGELLAFLRSPEPPTKMKEAWQALPRLRNLLAMAPKRIRQAPVQSIVIEKNDVDLRQLPIQTCWPDDVGPLITWPLVVTRGPVQKRQNLGIYRQQVIGRNRLIMRWLAHRGGALDYQMWRKKHPDTPFPVAVALGADPATTLAAVTPIPDTLSEYIFAGLLRGSRTELSPCLSHDLEIPAHAEIVLKGSFILGTKRMRDRLAITQAITTKWNGFLY